MKPISKLSFVTFSVAWLAGTPSLLGQEVAGPRIQFDSTSFDFGNVQPTDHPQHDFIFTNTGAATLEIKEVKPGCGCTTAGAWDKEVAPGKTGKIPLSFNPANFSGRVYKTATVKCNDPAMETLNLQFAANVWRPIDMQPQYAYFLPVEGEETNETKVIRIINNQDEAITLEPPQNSIAAFKTELKTVRPGKEFELLVTYTGGGTNGVVHDTVTVKSSSAKYQPLSLTAMVMPQPAMIAVPQTYQLPPGPFAPEYRPPPVTVRNNSHTEVKLSDPSVNAEGVTVKMVNAEPGKSWQIELGLPQNFRIQPGQTVELSFKTSHPRYPVMKLPITQLPPAPAPAPIVVPAATVPK